MPVGPAAPRRGDNLMTTPTAAVGSMPRTLSAPTNTTTAAAAAANPTEALAKRAHALHVPAPDFSVDRVGGQDHRPLFRAICTWLPERFCREGLGHSKMEAKRAAAAAMLVLLNSRELCPASFLTYEHPHCNVRAAPAQYNHNSNSTPTTTTWITNHMGNHNNKIIIKPFQDKFTAAATTSTAIPLPPPALHYVDRTPGDDMLRVLLAASHNPPTPTRKSSHARPPLRQPHHEHQRQQLPHQQQKTYLPLQAEQPRPLPQQQHVEQRPLQNEGPPPPSPSSHPQTSCASPPIPPPHPQLLSTAQEPAHMRSKEQDRLHIQRATGRQGEPQEEEKQNPAPQLAPPLLHKQSQPLRNTDDRLGPLPHSLANNSELVRTLHAVNDRPLVLSAPPHTTVVATPDAAPVTSAGDISVATIPPADTSDAASPVAVHPGTSVPPNDTPTQGHTPASLSESTPSEVSKQESEVALTSTSPTLTANFPDVVSSGTTSLPAGASDKSCPGNLADLADDEHVGVANTNGPFKTVGASGLPPKKKQWLPSTSLSPALEEDILAAERRKDVDDEHQIAAQLVDAQTRSIRAQPAAAQFVEPKLENVSTIAVPRKRPRPAEQQKAVLETQRHHIPQSKMPQTQRQEKPQASHIGSDVQSCSTALLFIHVDEIPAIQATTGLAGSAVAQALDLQVRAFGPQRTTPGGGDYLVPSWIDVCRVPLECSPRAVEFELAFCAGRNATALEQSGAGRIAIVSANPDYAGLAIPGLLDIVPPPDLVEHLTRLCKVA